MFGAWTTFGMLALESQQVILMRCMTLALGGEAAQLEAQRMVTEKITAAATAYGQIVTGASADRVMRGYRRKVRANARRLSR
jgi:hypothetical protein